MIRNAGLRRRCVPRVDVLAEIRQAGIYAARYPGKYRDGNAF